MKRCSWLLVMLVFADPAWARLGESPKECAKRYGDPVESTSVKGFEAREFMKSGIRVRVHFAMKKDTLFAYARAAGLAYSRPATASDGNRSLSPREIDTFLKANAQGEEWEETDPIRQAAESPPGPLRDKLIADAHRFRVWRRPSGATAHYMRRTHELVIRSDQRIPLPTAPAEEKKPLDSLDGF